MDKNMINIDDLLRQRLGGGEEKERPGSWLQMRDLLDQKMPVQQQPGSAFNWRRMLGVITGVVAISAVGLGGYQAVTSFRNNDDVTKGATASTGHTSTGSGRLAQAAANSEQQYSSKVATPVAPSTTVTGGTTNPGGANETGGKKASGAIAASGKATTNTNATTGNTSTRVSTIANKNTGTATTSIADNNNDATETVAGNQNDNSLISNGNNQSVRTVASTAGAIDDNIKSVPVADKATETTSTTTEGRNSNKNRKTARITRKANKNQASGSTALNSGTVVSTPTVTAAKTTNAVTTTTNKAKTNKSATATGSTKSVAKAKASGNSGTGTNNTPAAQVTTNNNNTPAGNNTPGQDNKDFVVAKESIAKIETRQTVTRDGKLKIDTISIGTVERDKFIAASAGDDKAAIGGQIASPADNVVVPASGATANNDFKGEVAPASKVRKNKKESIWSPKKLEEMVRNTRLSTNEVMFYPGIVAGMNGLFGSNPMAGFQMGVSGNLSLNQRWGIFSELKYVHRFNAGGGTMDSRDLGTIQQVIQNNQTTYQYTPTLRQYKVKDVKALELPLAVRYTFNTISVFMGVNYAYYFGMSPDLNEVKEAPVTSTTEPQIPGMKLAPGDFGSMHGMGYMLGVGYHFSPAMHLDARFANPMFSNVNTPGSKEVSKNVFTVPSVQVNFNYNFIREKKIK